MRFSQYKMIIDLFDSVVEAVEYMTTNSTFELTEECSNAMEKIIEAVNSEPDNIHLNDILQSINECFRNKSFYSDFYNDLLTIKKILPKNIKYKYKILFVAELGGKWDSMESVYKAFIKRDDCDVDVVIEPVFREVLMNDGSKKREIVYNDYLTPMGIKHIFYTNYDIAKIKPDITFTSQPYDSCTLPMFWSENLAKYSRLVYLPYFTATTFNNFSTAFNSYFKLETQKYSWKIPCQSKLMQEYYKHFASNKGRNTVVTGLPKWDFPMNLNKEDYPLPEEWKEKIKNRKVFLWNTHFSVDIYGSQLLTKKVWDFLDIFSKNKDIALIWRPHPMLETVIKVYYGDKEWHHYEKLKAFVESSDNMVIDKDGPYSYSFLYSDALISDLSSMIEQYLFTSKPILMLTKNSIEEEREKFKSNDRLFDYNRILFSDNHNTTKEFINAVCKGDSHVWDSEKNLIKDYFPLADSNVGKRLSDTLINDLYNEVINNDKKNTDFLIIGSIKDSLPCIKHFDDHGYDYYICDIFLEPSDIKNNEIENSIFTLDRIHDYIYKNIVITSKTDYQFISKILTDEYNIPNNDIIALWKIYNASIPKMVCDRVMKKPCSSSYEGLITGLSRTECGIISDLMDGNWCNLAVSTQDIYYQLQTLKYVLSEYADKLKDLKYAVVDLYDYHYLNYDTSLGTTVLSYWSWGGYNKDSHNFAHNKNFDYSFDNVINSIYAQKLNSITPEQADAWNNYFSGIFNYTDYEGFSANYDIKKRTRIISDEDIDNYDYERSRVTKIHSDTISENKSVFEEILKTLTEFNPDIKIYTVMLPKYKEVEERDVHLIPNHKEYFDETVEAMKKKYNFTHLNFKNLDSISNNRNCYFDAEHLNLYGAYKFTKILNDIISEGHE